MTSAPLIVRDHTGHPIDSGARVGSFRRDVPGTVTGRTADQLLVRHDGDDRDTAYSIAPISGAVPNLFLLNLDRAAAVPAK